MALVNGQHLRRDRAPFRLYVETGWLVSDIKSLVECDLAWAVLTKAVSEIEHSLEVARTRPGANPEWFRRASSALRLKRVALQEVANIRTKLEQQQIVQLGA
jgi:hypothetical protein